MKNFDLQRFGRVLRLDFVEARNILLWFTLGGVLAYLFFFWFAYNISMKTYDITDWEQYVKHVCEGVGIFSMVFMYIFFLATACTLYWDEQKKAKRTAHLMLPATCLEKFLARWVYMLAFSLMAGLLAFFVADGIHMAWLWLTDKPVVAATPYLFKAFPHTSDFSNGQWLDVFAFYCLLIAGHAFFLLGGVVFRKNQFVATALVGSVLLFTFAHFASKDQPYMQAIRVGWLYYLGLSLFFAMLICAFTVLAYRLYCRWQVVTRKYVNLP